MTIGVPEHTWAREVPADLTDDPRILRLVFPVSMDDHPRPDDWFWSRFHYPHTSLGVLLWRDGRYKIVDSLDQFDVGDPPDSYAQNGWLGRADSWQARVLMVNKFPLVECGVDKWTPAH